MRIVILVNNSANFDGRVRKTAFSLKGDGHEVTVVCRPGVSGLEKFHDHGVLFWPVAYRSPVASFAFWQKQSSIQTNTTDIRSLSQVPFLLKPIKFLLGGHLQDFWIHMECRQAMREAIKAIDPDVIHANDLDTLPAAVEGARQTGAKVVYDAHEIATDEYPDMRMGSRFWRRFQEARLIRKIDRFVTISEFADNHFRARYGICADAIVHNSPDDPSKTTGPGIREACGLSASIPLAVFTGYLREDRGRVEILHAISTLPDVHFACVGPKDDLIDAAVDELVSEYGIKDRFHRLLPVDAMKTAAFITGADVALIVNRNFSTNVDLALPNKFFDALLANVPLVVGRQQAVREMTERFGIGICVDERNPEDIASAMKRIISSKSTYKLPDDEMRRLIDEFGWRVQAKRLADVYSSLTASGPE